MLKTLLTTCLIVILMCAVLTAPALALPFEIERPSADDSNIGLRTENSCKNDEAAVGLGVHVMV